MGGATSTAGLRIDAAGCTHPGRLRAVNEDAFVVLPDEGLFIVSDGIGGNPGGAVAAQIVVRLLPEALHAAGPLPPEPQVSAHVGDVLLDLSQRLYRQSREGPDLEGLGATVVLGLVRQQQLVVANLGDSRAYRYRRGRLRQVTDDHSATGILLRRGEIRTDEVRRHPARNVLSRFVGMPESVRPDVRVLDLAAGDRWLLCSDGLTTMVDDAGIAAVLAVRAGSAATCARLVEVANAAGGEDNVTVVILDVRRPARNRQGGTTCPAR